VGIFAAEADAVIESTWVRNTKARADGLFGDGVVVRLSGAAQMSHALVRGSRIEGSARAGVAVFGSNGEVESTALECNQIHLDGEVFLERDFSVADLGGNACGCRGASVACKVLSTRLEPPLPVELTPGLAPE
jgi:hypothetical protein